jgi:hypothetical protein
MPEALHFYNDFACIEDSCKIQPTELEKALKDLDAEIKNAEQEMLATEQDSPEMASIPCIRVIAAKHQEVSDEWSNQVQKLKELAEFFGMFNTPQHELGQLFHTIQNFVGDFKQALNANNKLFAPEPEPQVVCPVIKRKSLPSTSNENKAKKRQSLGIFPTNFEDDGQSPELVNAITATSLWSPQPRKKTDGEIRRRKYRNSINIENQRERQ